MKLFKILLNLFKNLGFYSNLLQCFAWSSITRFGSTFSWSSDFTSFIWKSLSECIVLPNLLSLSRIFYWILRCSAHISSSCTMNIYIQNFYFTYVLLSFWDLNNCLNCNKVLAAIENPKVLKQITGFDCKRLRSAIKVLNNEDFQSIFILNFFVLISLFQKFIKIYLIQRIFNIIHLLPISSTGFLLKTKSIVK